MDCQIHRIGICYPSARVRAKSLQLTIHIKMLNTRYRFLIGITIYLLFCLSASAQSPDVELGKRIYREGILPSGQPIRVTLMGDITLEGAQFSCASCHRRSGFGSSEGATFTPPITGIWLYEASQPDRTELFRKLYQDVQPNRFSAKMRTPRLRPAYTDETLVTAILDGTDPTGREFDPVMPRYHLNNTDMGHLIAYLKTLSATIDPGVDQTEIHFATVVTEGVAPEPRKAMLDVIEAYFRWKNVDVQRWLMRPGYSLWYKDGFYKTHLRWVHHLWELKGTENTWRAQLEAYYRNQPVFALLSGIGIGEWQPIHDFCEEVEVPCLFPNTDLPVVEPLGAYSLYSSKGLTLEAQALAQHLHNQSESEGAVQIVQVYREEARGETLAKAFRQAFLDGSLAKAVTPLNLQDRVISADTIEISDLKLPANQPTILVLWLDAADFQTLKFPPNATDGIRQVYLSYSLLGKIPTSVSIPLPGKIYLTYPHALPGHEPPRIYRVRSWLRSRRVQRTHEGIQLNTYFALSIADHALVHIVENFHRDYFIESVEHETENALNPGIYPHLSLGPGQRFASKGCYIVELKGTEGGGIVPVSEWIVP
jgi:hypothetical protein